MQKTEVKIIISLSFIILSLFSLDCFGQAGIEYDLKKPEKFENRQLGYEKTSTTKFGIPRHFLQNSVTHYNYYFNANKKLNEVVARAKAQNRDDFTKLLPFYNYSLDITSRDKKELDSIISKATAGILIHDLRNDWVDNLYLLMGKAYYFRKDLDTAYIVFQFINYAFSPKEKDGYDKTIASNANHDEGGNAFIVSTKEKNNVAKKIFSLPPSRNEALVWQVKTFLAKDQLTAASVLIEALKHDPEFPNRLRPDLQEVQAWLFYKQNMYDSAAFHLEKTLGNAENSLEQARWEFLIAQLYEKANKSGLAQQFYEKAVQHTYDPVLEVFGRLYAIRQGNGTGEEYIKKNIDALVRMGRKEVYANYRDIIYYTAAEIELQNNNIPAAVDFLLKSVKSALPGSPEKNKAFLKLADLAFDQKKYKVAKNYYDSILVSGPSSSEIQDSFMDRKKALDKIVMEIGIIERQDSLQRIAAMTEGERTAYIKKLTKALHKQQGLADEEQQGSSNFSFNNNNAVASDLFRSGSDNAEWYFYNPSLKSKGFNDFRSKWGNRPNVDNWFLSSLASKQKIGINKNSANQGIAMENPGKPVAALISAESLLENIPLTAEKMKKSKDSVENAWYKLGKSYQDDLPDYRAAINAYDSLLEKFPSTNFREETLFNLYYCYKKIGDEAGAARILQLLNDKYPTGKYIQLISNPISENSEIRGKLAATLLYEKIYTAFIEGNFDEALSQKRTADSLYGDKYWTPQLLYIEAVYFIHQRRDSAAMSELGNILMKYSGTTMALKAKNLLDVLGRRKQIEEYLTGLKVERAKDDADIDENSKNLGLDNSPPPAKENLNDKSRIDSLHLIKQKPKTDTVQVVKKIPGFSSLFVYTPDKPHSVAILMIKIDPVYVTETRNAFNRYNRETYYNKTLDINNVVVDDTIKLVLISGFENADVAMEYMDKAKKLAPREIIPWLPDGKYSFLIITDQNLGILKNNKDTMAYKKFLSAYFPGRF